VDLNEVKNYTPYNNTDSCCKTHDLEYEKIFKIENKEKREKKIRESDEKLLKCVESYKNSEKLYYYPMKLGIETKIALENKNPNIIKNLFGEKYVGKK